MRCHNVHSLLWPFFLHIKQNKSVFVCTASLVERRFNVMTLEEHLSSVHELVFGSGLTTSQVANLSKAGHLLYNLFNLRYI